MFNEETQQFFDHYFDIFGMVSVNPAVFAGFVLILTLVFTLRFFILLEMEEQDKKRKTKKDRIIYTLIHCSLEYLISIVICDMLVKLVDSDCNNFMVDFILAPCVATLIGIYLNNKVIIPVENAAGFGTRLLKKKKEEKKDSSGQGNITININNGDDDKKDNSPKKPLNNSPTELLSADLADSEEFNTEIINAINGIKSENAMQNEIIIENTKKLDKTIEALDILKESEMINKKIELKKLIYLCLNQGYATPEQNDKITLLYSSYETLGGNHEIKSLYLNHYMKLQIHDATIPVAFSPIIEEAVSKMEATYLEQTPLLECDSEEIAPSIHPRRVYSYGEFDDEV